MELRKSEEEKWKHFHPELFFLFKKRLVHSYFIITVIPQPQQLSKCIVSWEIASYCICEPFDNLTLSHAKRVNSRRQMLLSLNWVNAYDLRLNGINTELRSKVGIVKKCRFWIWMPSVQFSRSVMSNSLQPHELQHARPPCPSPTPRVHSNSHPLNRWCHLAISFSVVPFSSCLQSLPASESFPMS